MTIHIPDVSEFQPNVDWTTVNKWNGGFGIIRAAYGDAHDDKSWYNGARREQFWKNGGKALGIYQYLVADQEPAAQARALVDLVKELRTGEFLICDLEEGTPSIQGPRFAEWAKVADAIKAPNDYAKSWLYSYDAFFRESPELMAVAHSRRHTWLAEICVTEPTDVPHSMWQYTDAAQVPGIPVHCDCSVFDGTPAALLKLINGQSTTRPKPKPHQPNVGHPFAKLKVDGHLGALTFAAMNHWLHDNQGNAANAVAIKALQRRIGMTGDLVDGSWGNKDAGLLHGDQCETTRQLQHFLDNHGQKVGEPDGTAHVGGGTFKAFQRFLNTEVGRH